MRVLAADLPKVQVGQDTPWGVATECCAGGLDGQWACAAHGIESFADPVSFATHIDDAAGGPHLIGWRCRRDDQIHGWKP